jgi:hypothetical protein
MHSVYRMVSHHFQKMRSTVCSNCHLSPAAWSQCCWTHRSITLPSNLINLLAPAWVVCTVYRSCKSRSRSCSSNPYFLFHFSTPLHYIELPFRHIKKKEMHPVPYKFFFVSALSRARARVRTHPPRVVSPSLTSSLLSLKTKCLVCVERSGLPPASNGPIAENGSL